MLGFHFFVQDGGVVVIQDNARGTGDVGPVDGSDGDGVREIVGVGDRSSGIYEIDDSLNVHLVECTGACCGGAHRTQ